MLSAAENQTLTQVGPGSDCGKWLRSFWFPIAISDNWEGPTAQLQLNEPFVYDDRAGTATSFGQEAGTFHGQPMAVRILGEDLVLYRDLGGTLGLMDRHCPHRSSSLEYGRPREKGLACPYHGWSYFNSGKISGVPWPDGYADDFSDPKYNLAQVPRVQSYRGFIFGTLNPEMPSLESYLGGIKKPLDEWLDRHPGGTLSFCDANRLKFNGNWKLLYDNSADGYHVIFSHRSLLAMENRLVERDEDDKGKEMEDQGVADRKKKPFFVFNLVVAALNIIQTIILAGVTITANVAPDLELPGLFWEGHKLSDLAIVEKIYLLNLTFLVVLLDVTVHVVPSRTPVITEWTRKRLFSCVHPHHVIFQLICLNAGKLAHCASVRLFPRVGSFVLLQIA